MLLALLDWTLLASRPRNTQVGQPQGSFSQTPQQENQRRGQQLRYTNNASRFSSGILGIAPVQCLWCDEFGHTVRTCTTHSSSLAAGSIKKSLAALQLDDSTWYPDTGVSAHMTSNLLSFSPQWSNLCWKWLSFASSTSSEFSRYLGKIFTRYPVQLQMDKILGLSHSSVSKLDRLVELPSFP